MVARDLTPTGLSGPAMAWGGGGSLAWLKVHGSNLTCTYFGATGKDLI